GRPPKAAGWGDRASGAAPASPGSPTSESATICKLAPSARGEHVPSARENNRDLQAPGMTIAPSCFAAANGFVWHLHHLSSLVAWRISSSERSPPLAAESATICKQQNIFAPDR